MLSLVWVSRKDLLEIATGIGADEGWVGKWRGYPRKSTEHKLDLEFNSLHAQRDACEAYVKSQMHEGWQPLVTGGAN